MAKRNTGRKNTSNESKGDTDYAVPEGFTINVGGERGEGWVTKEDGNVVQGRLLGRKEYKNTRGKTRAFYQIKLAKPCWAQVDNPDFNDEADEDEDKNPSMIRKRLDEGDVVNVDEFKKLEDLAPKCVDGGIYDVWFVIGPKVEIDNNQTMWTFRGGPVLRVVKKSGDSVPF